jgi:hypothetical protein
LDYAQYLRDRAADFANRALTAADPLVARNFHELAILCRESADRLARRTEATPAVSAPPVLPHLAE